jgi:Holliday junction resolvase RusA-like endonuclease
MKTPPETIVRLDTTSSRVVYIVPGPPTPLARARWGSIHNKCWDSQKAIKLAFGIELSKIHEKRPLFSGPLHIDLKFFLKTPIKAQSLDGSPHHYKPDLDNLIKFVLDVGNDILWKDDSCISSIRASKFYGAEPRTELIVMEIK